jgi:hypothetical protein
MIVYKNYYFIILISIIKKKKKNLDTEFTKRTSMHTVRKIGNDCNILMKNNL